MSATRTVAANRGLRRRLSPTLAALALAAALAAPGAASPVAKRFDISQAGISLTLPGNWTASAQKGWKFVAVRPDGEGKLFVESFREATGFFGFRTWFESYVRKTARADDPHATFETRAAKVAGERTVEIVARYGGLTAYAYGFAHDQDDFVVEYVTSTTFAAKNFPVFAASVRSIRFLPS